MSNNLQEIAKSMSCFNTPNNLLFADDIIQQYEKAGLLASAKIAKIAKHGFNFFEKHDLEIFLIDSVMRENPVKDKKHLPNVKLVAEQANNWDTPHTEYKYVEYNDEGEITDYSYPVYIPEKKEDYKIVTVTTVDSIYDRGYIRGYKYNDISITKKSIEDYPEIPPIEILEKITKAKELNVFDTISVLDVEQKTKIIRDPIVVGQINQRPDTFFLITAWDVNVEITDILSQDIALITQNTIDNDLLCLE